VTQYTYAQIEEIWIRNGGNKAMAPLMAAIAEVESAGNPDAENPSGATGLWQLEWPLYSGYVAGATSRQAYHNPDINAKAAIKLSQNNPSVSPGSPVYNNWIKFEFPFNAYLKYLKGGVPPSTPNQPQQTSPAQTAGLISWPGDITGFFHDAKTFTDALLWIVNPASWLRIGSFFIGAILILMAVWIFVKVGSGEPIIKTPSAIPVPVPV
jgi:Transglycosylase SLT domain